MKHSHHSVWLIDSSKFPFNESRKKQIEFLLGYAILAPSAHNAQPWQVKTQTDSIVVAYDRKFALTQSDPVSRQAFLSLGAFVTNFCVASESFGLKNTIEWLPDSGQSDWVSRVTIEGNPTKMSQGSDATNLIINRSVDRSMYLNKSIPDKLEADLQNLLPDGLEIKIIADNTIRARLARCVSKGMEFAFKNTNFRRELSQYIVPNSSDQKVGIPGYTAGLNEAASHIVPRLMWYFDIGKGQSDLEYQRFASSPAIAVISSRIDNPRAWLVTGYWYQRIALELTKLGMVHALSGAPIEAPVLPRKVQSILNSDYRPLIFFRIGYSSQKTIHSPRRPVSDILVT